MSESSTSITSPTNGCTTRRLAKKCEFAQTVTIPTPHFYHLLKHPSNHPTTPTWGTTFLRPASWRVPVAFSMKDYAPKKTGKFAAGLRRWRRPAAIRQNRPQIDIVAGGVHGFLGKLITGGTRPHVIRSSRPMPISYEGEECRFAHTVNHPGTKANDFAQRAMRGINKRLKARAQSRVRRLSMVR